MAKRLALAACAFSLSIACGPATTPRAAIAASDSSVPVSSTRAHDAAANQRDAGAPSVTVDAATVGDAANQFAMPKDCGDKACGLYGIVGVFEPCCVGREADGVCGISVYRGPCGTRVYGRINPSCPSFPTMLGNFPGCCRPDSLCGFVNDLGCTAVLLPDGSVPMACDWDAGAD